MEEEAINSNSLKPSTSRGGWRSAIFIIFVEVAERFSYYGVAGNIFTYLTRVLQQPTSTAAKTVNIWLGFSAIFPVLGGFLADSYLGRFKTIVFSTVIYFSGLILLTVSASGIPPRLRRGVFFTALYTLSVGEGGHKPCVQTFAADQFDERIPEEKLAKSSFFNWWYVGIVCGATFSILVVIYIEDNIGWTLGFGMLATVVAAALIVFLVGTTTYRRQAPVGSPFTRVAQVVVAAVRKRRLSEREGRDVCDEDDEKSHLGAQPLARTTHFRFLDKAMVMDDEDASTDKRNPWRLCTLTQIEETKLLFQLIPIWFACLMFAVDIAQIGTYFTKQGSTMDRSLTSTFQIPPATMQVFTGLTILTAVFLYERFLIPFTRPITGLPSGITMLQRIGIGLFLSIVTMVVAALVEFKRIHVARDYGLLDKPNSVVPMAVWWLTPQYVLCGLSDVFTIVGLQELFYDQMPVGMRSIGAAAYITITGVGNFLSGTLISIIQGVSAKAGHEWLGGNNINGANLAYFYGLLACLSGMNLCVYVCVARRFVYRVERGMSQGG